MQVQELVGIVPWTFIAQILNLFLQIYLIKRFLFKPINEMLEKRKAKADAQIQDADKARTEALALKTEYEQSMQDARSKANEILSAAQKTAQNQSEEIIKEEEVKDEDKAALKYKKNGEYHYGSDPNTYVRVNVIHVPVSSSSRSSSSRSSGSTRPRGGGGGGSSCAHSSCACACASCACACACACAGGGRAGCSTKDFYNTKLKLKQLEMKKKK